MQVPFVDLTVSTQQIQDEYLKAVEALLDKGQFVLTQEGEDFEKAWSQYIGVEHCAGVSCGADALYLSLIACGVSGGDEVIIQGNAYNACVTAILRCGAIPRFSDINPDTLTLHTEAIEPLINKKTRAILPVHLYGQPCDMDAVMSIAKKHGCKVIEDCAQAHGAQYNGKKVGSIGDIGAWSFYPTKNLGAFGEAGAITTNNKEIHDEIVARRDLGQIAKNEHRYFGTNMRLDPIQAIALSLQLRFFEENTKKRQEAALYYDSQIQSDKLILKIAHHIPHTEHVYHLYVVQTDGYDRDLLRKKLEERGVQTAIHYPVPVYRQPFFKNVIDNCPVTDTVCNNILSLPLFLGISREQQDYVIVNLKEILQNNE